jgi:hypothetical protein
MLLTSTSVDISRRSLRTQEDDIKTLGLFFFKILVRKKRFEKKRQPFFILLHHFCMMDDYIRVSPLLLSKDPLSFRPISESFLRDDNNYPLEIKNTETGKVYKGCNLLNTGAFGAVVSTKITTTDGKVRPVACKLIYVPNNETGGGFQSFGEDGATMREVALTNTITSPNVIEILGTFIGEAGGAGLCRVIVMPLADIDLYSFLEGKLLNCEELEVFIIT